MDEDGGALRIRSGGEGWSQGTAGASGSIRASARYVLGALSSLRICVGRVSDRHRAGVSGRHHRHDGVGLWGHRAGTDRIGLHGSRVLQPALPAFPAFALMATSRARVAWDRRRASHIWMARFSTANAASFTASVNVGWGWQVRAMSSDAAPNSMATAASAIILPASAPTMWTPSTRSVLASARIFTKPSVCRFTFARPLAVKGNLPVL